MDLKNTSIQNIEAKDIGGATKPISKKTMAYENNYRNPAFRL